MGLLSRERRWRSRPQRTHSEEDALRSSGMRLVVLRLVIVLLFCALALQLLRFQVWSGGRYQLKAESNRLRLLTTEPARGLMYDRNHNPLVRNVASYTAVIVPADLPKGHESEIYFQLSGLIGVPPDVIEQKVQDALKRNDPFTPVHIKEQLDQRTVLTLAELRHTLPGVDVRYDAVREYSEPALMSHIYGYTGKIDESDYDALKARGYKLDDKVGQAGLEYVYEDQLRGAPGKQQVEVDATGRELRQLDSVAAKPGNSLVLSIDLDLQQHVTDILQKSLNENGSVIGVAIMMDVHTGEILAYVSLPNYDSSVYASPIRDGKIIDAWNNDPGKPQLDHAIADAYPPGSTFKVITASAALEKGVATTTTTLTSRGSFSLSADPNDPVNRVYDWADLGPLDFYRGLAMSSDIYFYCLAGGCPQLAGGGIARDKALGNQRLHDAALDFGLGAKTGIDLPGEAAGLIPDENWKPRTQKDEKGNGLGWQPVDTYFMGIGQGYDTATPIQMVRVAATLANGGDLLRPHIVREIVDASGNVVQPPQKDIVRHVGISDANLAIVREGMRQAVDGGSAASAYLPGYQIAGKTGTAEFGEAIVKPTGDGQNQNGKYNEHGWFISFAPFDNPQVALVVFHDRGGGAATAAPTARKIWDYYFNAYKQGNPNPEKAASPTPGAGR